MDISFKIDDSKFNYRVCGIIISEGKILAMHDEVSPYFYLPGGRVTLGEECDHAIVREMQEELKITPEIIRPLWLNQSFFTEVVNGLKYHELCIYYLLDISKTDLLSRGQKFTITEGEHTLTFEWLEFERLKDEYIFPLFIKEKIFELPENLTLLTTYQ